MDGSVLTVLLVVAIALVVLSMAVRSQRRGSQWRRRGGVASPMFFGDSGSHGSHDHGLGGGCSDSGGFGGGDGGGGGGGDGGGGGC